MTTSPDDFNKISQAINEKLLNHGEIAFRTIINKSYYGLIHKLKLKIEKEYHFKSYNLNSLHQGLINNTKQKIGLEYSKN